jgi:hypothetical protein
LAYRAIWKLHWDPKLDRLTWIQGKANDPAYAPTTEQFSLLKAYNLVWPYLVNRQVSDGERCIFYRSGGHTVAWCCQNTEFRVSGAPTRILDVLKNQTIEASTVRAKPRSIYLIDGERDCHEPAAPFRTDAPRP